MQYVLYLLTDHARYLSELEPDAVTPAQIAEVNEAITILKQHAQPTTCTIQLNC